MFAFVIYCRWQILCVTYLFTRIISQKSYCYFSTNGFEKPDGSSRPDGRSELQQRPSFNVI